MSTQPADVDPNKFVSIEAKEIETPGTIFLRQSGVAYDAFYVPKDHTQESSGPKTTATAARFGLSEHNVVKSLIFYDNDTKVPFVVLQHGDCLVNTKALAKHVGSKKVGPCTHDMAIEVSGYIPGGVSPFGLKNKIQVYMEASIVDSAKVIINGGDKECMILISPKDIMASYESAHAVEQGYSPIKLVSCAKLRTSLPPQDSGQKGGSSGSVATVAASVPTSSSAKFVQPSANMSPESTLRAAQSLLAEIEAIDSFFPKNNLHSNNVNSSPEDAIRNLLGSSNEKLELLVDKPALISQLKQAVEKHSSSPITTLPELCMTFFLDCETVSGKPMRLNVRVFTPSGYPHAGIPARAAVTLLPPEIQSEIDLSGIDAIIDEELANASADGHPSIVTSIHAVLDAIKNVQSAAYYTSVNQGTKHAHTETETKEERVPTRYETSHPEELKIGSLAPLKPGQRKHPSTYGIIPLSDCLDVPRDEEGNILKEWMYSLIGRVLVQNKPVGLSSPLALAPRDKPLELLGKAKSNIRIGLVGLPNVGKSSLFNLISGLQVPAENYPFCTIKPNEATVPIMDARYKTLVDAFMPTNALPPVLRIYDIAGLVKGASVGKGLGNEFLHHISVVQVIFQVVRAFDDADVTHVEGTVDPVRDIEIINTELVAKDLERMYTRIERLSNKGKVFVGLQQEKDRQAELEILLKAHEWLRQGHCLRHCAWTSTERAYLSTLQLWTNKPVCYVVNMSAMQYADEVTRENVAAPVREWINEHSPESIAIPISVPFESATLVCPGDYSPRQVAAVSKAQEILRKSTLDDELAVESIRLGRPVFEVDTNESLLSSSSNKSKEDESKSSKSIKSDSKSHKDPKHQKKEKKSHSIKGSSKVQVSGLTSFASAFDSYLDEDGGEGGDNSMSLFPAEDTDKPKSLKKPSLDHDKQAKKDKKDKKDKKSEGDKDTNSSSLSSLSSTSSVPLLQADEVKSTALSTYGSSSQEQLILSRDEMMNAIKFLRKYLDEQDSTSGEKKNAEVQEADEPSEAHGASALSETCTGAGLPSKDKPEEHNLDHDHEQDHDHDSSEISSGSRVLLYRSNSALLHLIECGYRAAQLVHFFCCDRHLVRGYMIPAKTKAASASARIHYLNEKLFLSCEVCSFEDWQKCSRSLVKAKSLGCVRTCGRDYIVQDGDLIRFKFMPSSKLENTSK